MHDHVGEYELEYELWSPYLGCLEEIESHLDCLEASLAAHTELEHGEPSSQVASFNSTCTMFGSLYRSRLVCQTFYYGTCACSSVGMR